MHAGARRRDVTIILLLEGAFWMTAVVPVTMGASALVAAPESAADRGALVVQGSRVALASFVAGVGGIAAAVVSVREQRLLRYFRDR